MEERIEVRNFVLGAMETNCYLVWSPSAGQAVAIDPGGDVFAVLAELKRLGTILTLVINTHGHVDHISGNTALAKATGAPVAIGADDAPMLSDALTNLSCWVGAPIASPAPSRLLRHGDEVAIGETVLTVRAAPGHTPGGIVLVGEGIVFSGDTLFAGSVGRTDLPGGDEEALMASIRRELMTLPDATVVYPGHGASTTIGRERTGNPFIG